MRKELEKLTDKQLLSKGEELSTLITELSSVDENSSNSEILKNPAKRYLVNKTLEDGSKDEIHENAAQLYLIDKILTERGYDQYQPTIDYYEQELKVEKDKVYTDAYAYVAIGLVVFTATTVYAVGYAPNRITWLSQALSLTLMIRGIIKFFTPRIIYYSKQ